MERTVQAALLGAGTALVWLWPASPGRAADRDWSNTDATWPPDLVSQNWTLPANWGGNVPGAGDRAWIDEGTAVLDTAVSVSRFSLGDLGYDTTSGLWIASGGSLTTPQVTFDNLAGSQWLTVAEGGSLTVTSQIVMGNTSETSGWAGSLFTNAGTVTTPSLRIVKKGVFLMTGGMLTAKGASPAIHVGNSGSTVPDEGKFIQTGGVVDAGLLQLDSGGTLEFHGGTFDMQTGYLWFAYASATPGTLGGTVHVVGSGATKIAFNGLRYFSTGGITANRDKATWWFTADNSANHLTHIDFTINGSEGGNVRGGTLKVELQGGVMLTGTNALKLMEAPDILGTSNFLNAADFEGATAKLWTQSIVNQGATDALTVTLTAAADKGAIDLDGANALSFGPSSYGYVDLLNVDPLAGPLRVSLDITGGTLSNLTDALSAAEINWMTGSGGYDVMFEMDPSITGWDYFAWDFDLIDIQMELQAILFETVPEPSSWALLAVGLGVVGMARRRRART